MKRELAKELIEKWFKMKSTLYGADNFTLPIKDEIIYSYCTQNDIIEYTLFYCMSVYCSDISIDQ